MLLSAADELAMGQQADPQVLQTFGKYEDAELAGVVAHEIGHIAAQISVSGPVGWKVNNTSSQVQMFNQEQNAIILFSMARRGPGRIFFMTFSLIGRRGPGDLRRFGAAPRLLSRFSYFQLNLTSLHVIIYHP